MQFTDILRRSGRTLRSAKVRTLLTALAIAVGTFSLTLTLAASNGAQEFVDQIIADNFDPAELIVSQDDRVFGQGDSSQPREYDPSFGAIASPAGAATQIQRLTDEDITELEQLEAVEQVRKNRVVNLQYLTREGQPKYVGTMSSVNPYQSPELRAGEVPDDMRGSILLPEAYVAALGFNDPAAAIGESIDVSVLPTGQLRQTPPIEEQNLEDFLEEQSQTRTFTIAGVLAPPLSSQPGTELYLYGDPADVAELQEITTRGTQDYQRYNAVFVRIAGGEDPDILKAGQEDIRELGYVAQSVQDTQDFLNQIIAVLQGIVAGFAVIAIIASVFGIINTMYISVLQRTREIGLMKALGMRSRDIGRLFRFEAAWIGFLGGAIGSVLAVALGVAINPWLSEAIDLGEGNYLLLFNWVEIAGLIAALVIVSILAGWLPSRKAAKLDPIVALRTE